MWTGFLIVAAIASRSNCALRCCPPVGSASKTPDKGRGECFTFDRSRIGASHPVDAEAVRANGRCQSRDPLPTLARALSGASGACAAPTARPAARATKIASAVVRLRVAGRRSGQAIVARGKGLFPPPVSRPRWLQPCATRGHRVTFRPATSSPSAAAIRQSA
jgi:hypothetical protein